MFELFFDTKEQENCLFSGIPSHRAALDLAEQVLMMKHASNVRVLTPAGSVERIKHLNSVDWPVVVRSE